LTGKPPFYKNSKESLFDWIKNSYNLEVPKHVSPTSIDLLGRLLNKIPEKRLGVRNYEDLKNHGFFSGLDWKKLEDKIFPEGGIFTQKEIAQAVRGQTANDDSIDQEEELMQKVKTKIDFYDEDYLSGEEINPVRKNYGKVNIKIYNRKFRLRTYD